MDVPALNIENGQTVINSLQVVDAVQVIFMDLECILEPSPTSKCLSRMFAVSRYKAELMLFLQRVTVIAAKIDEPELIVH